MSIDERPLRREMGEIVHLNAAQVAPVKKDRKRRFGRIF